MNELRILRNALTNRTKECQLVTSGFRYNIEYLDCLKDINRIYECGNGSQVLLKVTQGDSSNTISIESQTYLLEYCGPDFSNDIDEKEILKKITKLGIDHYASQLIAKSIKTSKPIDLIDFIQNHLAAVNQDSLFYIDTVDSEGNERRVVCNLIDNEYERENRSINQ